jgi:hypothetical protein
MIQSLARVAFATAVFVGLGAGSGWSVAGASAPNCNMRANKVAHDGPRIAHPVTLSLESQSDQVLSFGENRGTKVDYVTLKSSPPLPKSVRPGQIELDSLVPMKRIGAENLESTRLRFPRFIQPRISAHGERISFGVCVNAASGEPGTYTGQVEVNGPAGLGPFQLTQTAQLKAKIIGGFGAFFVLALLIASIFVWRKIGDETAATGGRKLRAQLAVAAISVAAAGYAMWKVYDETPDWGADWFASLAALVATAFAAGGIGTGVAALSSLVTGTPSASEETRDPNG